MRNLHYWINYQVASQFILHYNHKAFKYTQRQHKLNSQHGKGVEFLQYFHFTIKYTSGKLNQGVYALSRRHLLLFQLYACILRFKHLNSLQVDYEDFRSFVNNTKGIQREISLFKRDTYSRVPNCASRNVAPMSWLLERFIRDHWLDILEITRP